MESIADQREPSHPPVSVAGANSSSCPGLVLLPHYAKLTDDFSAVTDGKTISATSCTSMGRRFHISFGLVPSPGISGFSYCWEDPDPHANDHRAQCPLVLAAHEDCVLLEVTTPSTSTSSLSPRPPPNYYVYQASAAGRPPSLLLLPSCYIPSYYDRRGGAYPPELQATARNMIYGKTGLLRRGEDDIVVAVLEVDTDEEEVAELEVDTEKQEAAELCLLRLGCDWEWQLKRVPVVVHDDDDKGSRDDGRQDYGDPLMSWWTDAAFAVGDRFLCWVDYIHGFLVVDMAEDESSLVLRYTPLPVVPGDPFDHDDGRNMRWTRNIGPVGDGSVRFVDVESRCCCGEPGSTRCERGRFLFTVKTWTLKLSMDEPMEWVKNGVLELWAQPEYTGLPRVTVEYPIVVNSDTICFVVETDYGCYSTDNIDKKTNIIEVDT